MVAGQHSRRRRARWPSRSTRTRRQGRTRVRAGAAGRLRRHRVRRAVDRQQADREAPGVIELDFELVQGSFTLDVHTQLDGRAAALFGPSGAGKTTILDAIAGLRAPRHGTDQDARAHLVFVRRRRQPAAARPSRWLRSPGRRALSSHGRARGTCCMDVIRALSPDLARVTAMLEIDTLLSRRVNQLSGGERQRVALARALMSGPVAPAARRAACRRRRPAPPADPAVPGARPRRADRADRVRLARSGRGRTARRSGRPDR